MKPYRYLEIKRELKKNDDTLWVIWIQNKSNEPNFYFRETTTPSVKRSVRLLMKMAFGENNNE